MISKIYVRYFFIASVFFFILSASSVSAATLYSQTISLVPGWNIVSTPKVLESHSFSAQEVSGNFDIYILNPSSASGWSTMAQLGQTEFTPLYGYFINNKTGSNQQLTLNYLAGVAPLSRIFDRTFTTMGWYSVGVANPTYAKTIASSTTDTNNPDFILGSIINYDSVIDFTSASSTASSTRNSVALVDPWQVRAKSQVNMLSDFRETKGYAIHISALNNSYSGFQDLAVQGPTSSTTLSLSLNSANYPAADAVAAAGADSNELDKLALLAIDFVASNNEMTLDTLTANITASGSTATTTAAYLYEGSTLISSVSLTPSGSAVFSGLSLSLNANATTTLTLKVDIRNATATTTIVTAVIPYSSATGQDIYGSAVGSTTSSASISSENFYVRNVGPSFSLISKGISVSGSNSSNSTSTITGTFSVQVQALGGDISFGTQASATPMFGFKIYNIAGADVTATAGAGATTSSFTIPVSGVVTPINGDVNSFTLQENNTMTLNPVTLSVPGKTPNGIAQNNLSIGIDAIRWVASSRQTSSFMSGTSAWRTSVQAP